MIPQPNEASATSTMGHQSTDAPITRRVAAAIVSLTCSLLLLTRAWSVTVVSGNVSGMWTTNGSPYILTADCTVASNQTLTIQPGVEVIVGPGVTLNVEGGITAIGRPEQFIVIRGVTPTNYWRSIAMVYSEFTNRF